MVEPRDALKAYRILEKYKGSSSQMLYYKRLHEQGILSLDEFSIKYILTNAEYKPREINKMIKVSSDYGKQLKEKFNLEFTPKKLYITTIIGEMGNTYHCYCIYRKSKPATLLFINKKYILTPLTDTQYETLDVDFDKYDKLTENIGRKLKEHQKTAVKFLLTNKKCILADSQGLGKTTSAIIAALEGGFNKILVITTKAVKTTWKKEIMLYADESEIAIMKGSNWKNPKKFNITNYDIIQNFYTVPMEQEYTEELTYDENGKVHKKRVPVFITDKKTGEQVPKMIKSRKKSVINNAMAESELFHEHFDCVIIDEAQKLSNNGSIRYKTICDFLTRTNPTAIFLLTGTPLTNRPMNLYHILRLINADITKDYEYYCRRYCEGKKIRLKTGKEIMLNNGVSNLDELREKIKHLYIRRLQSEIPGMVNKDVITKYYDLDEKQAEQYATLWDEYVNAQEEKGNTDSEKYRQLVEGTIVRQFLANEMTKHTIELADSQIDYGEKVIIVCTYQEEIEKFKKHYGKKAVVYDGKMSIKQKDEAVDKFMNDPNTMVFIGQIIACGVGLTLTSSKYLIFNSYSWVAADNLQVQDRIYRLTQTRDVTCIYQLFTDSISQYMFEKVMKKELIMNETIKSENEKRE